MAYSTRVGPFVDQLVTSISSLSPKNSPAEFRTCRDNAIKALKSSPLAQTNQYSLQETFDGLDEKFRVLGRDDLADAVRVRFDELTVLDQQSAREALVLLLQLSDSPVKKSDVADLEKLKPAPGTPELTWEDILRDDPYDDEGSEGIWEDIDYAVSSTDDGEDEVSADEDDVKPARRRKEESPIYNKAGGQLAFIDQSAVEALKESQFWRTRRVEDDAQSSSAESESSARSSDLNSVSMPLNLTELQLTREVLYMLLGLSCELYATSIDSASVQLKRPISVSHLRRETLDGLLQGFQRIGLDIQQVRRWLLHDQTTPTVQSFQHAVEAATHDFDLDISGIEKRLLVQPQVVVSLISVFADVERISAPLGKFSGLLQSMIRTSGASPERLEPSTILEALYSAMNSTQMISDSANEADPYLKLLTSLFFTTLKTYLQPIRRWMTVGELPTLDDVAFFIGLADKDCEPAQLWHDKFVLRRDSNGKLLAPGFMAPVASMIFNAGKTVSFLHRLGYDITSIRKEMESDSDWDLERLSQSGSSSVAEDPLQLIPFQDRFDSIFQGLIRSKHDVASSILRDILLFSPTSPHPLPEIQRSANDGGILHLLNVFERVYFAQEGAAFQSFAEALFDKIDRDIELHGAHGVSHFGPVRGRKGAAWNDRYILTEVAQEVYGALPSLEERNLRVQALPLSSIRGTAKGDRGSEKLMPIQLTSIRALECVAVTYQLHWSVLNIISSTSIVTYQRVLVLLQQNFRCTHILHRAHQCLRLSSSTIAATSRSTSTQARLLRAAVYTPGALRLRHRLLFFTTTLHSHLTTAILAPALADLRLVLTHSCEDLDAMTKSHERFIEKIQARCLLQDRLEPILRALLQVLDLGVDFGRAWMRQMILAQEQEQDAEKLDARKDSKTLTTSTSKQTDGRKLERREGQQRGRSTRRRRRRVADVGIQGLHLDSSSEDEHEEDAEKDGEESDDENSNPQPNQTSSAKSRAHPSKAADDPSTFHARIAPISRDFDSLLAFIIAGLRGISRAGTSRTTDSETNGTAADDEQTQATWEMLADRLDWEKGKG